MPHGEYTYVEPVLDFEHPSFDPDALHRKYIEEREKRLNPKGTAQYENVGDHLAFLKDPWAVPFERDAIKEETEVVVVGGGIAAILAAVRLQEKGVTNIRMIEKAGDFGGTWYWNRYPGAQCDCESHIYLPLLDETGYIPTERYAHSDEIRSYLSSIGKKYNLYDRALFQTEILGMKWDEAASRWTVETSRGDDIRARFVIICSGPLHRLKLPGVPGIDSFEGHAWHTSRWDYNYTGPKLENLKDKRVGIIGTGATAIQAVPYLGAAAKELYVFQRTPSSVDIRGNRKTDPEWAKNLKPGWSRRRREQFQNIIMGVPEDGNDVNDGWTWASIFVGKAAMAGPPETMVERMGLANDAWQERLRKRVDEIVKDKETAEKLKPWYFYFCLQGTSLRPTFNDEYYETFNRPNVHLVDTNGKGIDRVEPNGIVANGKLYELDAIVFACGFELGTSYARRQGFELTGKNGLTLTEKWKDGVISLHGIFTTGFPNAFFIQISQAVVTISNTQGIDEMVTNVAHIVAEAEKRGAKTVEVTAEAEEAWLEEHMKTANEAMAMQANCTPGYYNDEGKLGLASAFMGRNAPFGGLSGTKVYLDTLKQFRESELPGLTFA
ncbi:putative monooxygenase [Hyaloraphidium curvatum]|nr:putative monooxygenase [Hyaloraphidium curvatum]